MLYSKAGRGSSKNGSNTRRSIGNSGTVVAYSACDTETCSESSNRN